MKTLADKAAGYKTLVANLVLCLIVLGLSVAFVVVKREVKSYESIMNLIILGCSVVAILLMLVIHNKVRSPILRLIIMFLGIALLVTGVLLIVDLSNNEDNIKYVGYVNGGFSIVLGLLFVVENVLILK
jgi:hypothetical protein